MEFENAAINSVKSISQRALASYWDRLAKGRCFPSMSDFSPEPRIHDPKQLVVWRVEREGSERRFRALYQGGHINDAFDSPWTGKTMEEVIPEFVKSFSIDAADECALSGCAVYTVLSTWDANGRKIDCERLLLPFGRDGILVEQIVASLQLISPEGKLERRSVLDRFRLRAELSFAGKIRSGFTRQKLEARADEVIE